MREIHEIILERAGDIGVLKINNPPENYLENPELIPLDALKKFLEKGIKSLVITGAGRNFSAGADMRKMKEQIKDERCFTEQLIHGNSVLNYLDELDIPVIAAISGVCFGAGLEVALACDIRIADTDSLFAFPEINQGVFPGLGGINRLTLLTGKTVAMELVMHGDMINAEKAKSLGVVDQVAEHRQVLEQALELARKMTDNRPLTVIHAIMTSFAHHQQMPEEEAMRLDAGMFTRLVQDMENNG